MAVQTLVALDEAATEIFERLLVESPVIQEYFDFVDLPFVAHIEGEGEIVVRGVDAVFDQLTRPALPQR